MRKAETQVHVSAFCPGYVRSELAEAERNRPTHLRNPVLDDANEAELKGRNEAFGSRVATGMDPLEAADYLFQALREDRFYVLSHHNAKKAVRRRTPPPRRPLERK